MTFFTLLFSILVVCLIAMLPGWAHSKSWGYWPSGVSSGLMLLAIIVMLTSHA